MGKFKFLSKNNLNKIEKFDQLERGIKKKDTPGVFARIYSIDTEGATVICENCISYTISSSFKESMWTFPHLGDSISVHTIEIVLFPSIVDELYQSYKKGNRYNLEIIENRQETVFLDGIITNMFLEENEIRVIMRFDLARSSSLG